MLSVLILGWKSPSGRREVAVAAGPPRQPGDVAGERGRRGTWLRSPPLCSSGTGFVVDSQSWGVQGTLTGLMCIDYHPSDYRCWEKK